MSLMITKAEFFDRIMLGEEEHKTHSFTEDGTDAIHDHLRELAESGTALDASKVTTRCHFTEDETKAVLEYYNFDSVEELQQETWAFRIQRDGVDRVVYNPNF